MDFDQLLRKYLSGALSDIELERFRDLLERMPEYKVELHQILELRSLIQDDALNLLLPEELSDNVRMAVGQQFAVESVLRREREEDRRRTLIAPFRIAAGVAVTTFVVMMVALGPTLIQPFGASSTNDGQFVANHLGDTSNQITSVKIPTQIPETATNRNDASTMATQHSKTSVASISRGSGNKTSVNHFARALKSSSLAVKTLANEQAPQTQIGPNPPTTVASGDINQEVSGTNHSVVIVSESNQASTLDLLKYLPNPSIPAITYSPKFDSSRLARVETSTLVALSNSDGIIAGEPRFMTIGLTLGTGRVTETAATTSPLMQNSYYFSFSVSSYDRIGVEMGASAFRQDKSTSLFGQSSGFAKGGSGSTLQSASDSSGTSGITRSTSSETSVQVVAKRIEQQITYGAVFYDRRIQLAEGWDLCGRAAFGAADNALIGNLRAYAAFSPSKNVTFTLGVGGSGLYNLSTKGADGSGNIGVYYGIETGF